MQNDRGEIERDGEGDGDVFRQERERERGNEEGDRRVVGRRAEEELINPSLTAERNGRKVRALHYLRPQQKVSRLTRQDDKK